MNLPISTNLTLSNWSLFCLASMRSEMSFMIWAISWRIMLALRNFHTGFLHPLPGPQTELGFHHPFSHHLTWQWHMPGHLKSQHPWNHWTWHTWPDPDFQKNPPEIGCEIELHLLPPSKSGSSGSSWRKQAWLESRQAKWGKPATIWQSGPSLDLNPNWHGVGHLHWPVFATWYKQKSLYEQWLRMVCFWHCNNTTWNVLVYWIMVCHPKPNQPKQFRRSHVNGQESRNNRVHKSFTKNTLVDLTWFDLIENNCDLNDTEQPVTAAHHHIKVPSSATIVPQQSSFNITATRQGLITILHTGFYSKAVQQNMVSHGQASL